MRATFLAVAALVAALNSSEPARFQERPAWIESGAPRMASAQAQLEHARGLRRRMFLAEGEELAFWRGRVVAAYRAVRRFHPEARALAVEAAFRAGEILRAAGEEGAALEEFVWCREHGAGTRFRARAGLEIGHLHRRKERWPAALEAYLDVAMDLTASTARREDAWLWAGTAWKNQGRRDEARSAWRRVAEHGSDACTRIQAYDELALLLLESGDPEGAAGVLDECLVALSGRAAEETREGERTRAALANMRVVAELVHAVERGESSQAAQGTRRNS